MSGKPLRRSVLWYQTKYEEGYALFTKDGNSKEKAITLQKPLKDLLLAWEAVKAKDPDDQYSFFSIAAYHGASFNKKTIDRNPPEKGSPYWGGYCHHGSILFPTWHRLFVREVEKALQSVNPEVTLPFWDETDTYSLSNGVPWVLTRNVVEFVDGTVINNPLVSFTLPLPVTVNQDDIANQGVDYGKEKGYTSVRYPFSGLKGDAARYHNSMVSKVFPKEEKLEEAFNANMKQWLNGDFLPKETNVSVNPKKYKIPDSINIDKLFKKSFLVKNYVVYSNTTSAAAYCSKHPTSDLAISLEQPHNDIHLSVGGFTLQIDVDGKPQYTAYGIIDGANGDMGENETASYDPIFFFHHCNIDRMFWLWQVKHNKITCHSLQCDYDVFVKEYATSINPITPNIGLSTTDNQGPTPNFGWGQQLSYETPLYPFFKQAGIPYNSTDVWNISDLNYNYDVGSLVKVPIKLPNHVIFYNYWFRTPKKTLEIEIARGAVSGSILLQVNIEVNGEWIYIGHHSTLSRTVVGACANCQNTLVVTAHIQLPNFITKEFSKSNAKTTHVKIYTKIRGSTIENDLIVPLTQLVNSVEDSFIPSPINPPIKSIKYI
eukprot:gene20821-26989_t